MVLSGRTYRPVLDSTRMRANQHHARRQGADCLVAAHDGFPGRISELSRKTPGYHSSPSTSSAAMGCSTKISHSSGPHRSATVPGIHAHSSRSSWNRTGQHSADLLIGLPT